MAKLNEKKTLAPGGTACSLLSELKLRGIIENARQMLKVLLSYPARNSGHFHLDSTCLRLLICIGWSNS